ncbi:hypothetical protein Tco_0673922 [Tanacetum coccineum]
MLENWNRLDLSLNRKIQMLVIDCGRVFQFKEDDDENKPCGEVIHTVKIDEVRQIVDVESSGKSADEIDKETVSLVICD